MEVCRRRRFIDVGIQGQEVQHLARRLSLRRLDRQDEAVPKRGFKNKRDAVKWEKETLDRLNGNTDMTFASFVERYTEDMKPRLKENTWHTKEHVIRTKFLPYFGKRKLSEIKSQDILRWQNELTTHTDENGKPFSPVYLRSVSSQLSCLFNRAVKYYGLPANPVKKAGHMGTKKSREMLFWCGLREGELLALTPSDFDFEKGTVSVSKTYTRLNRKDVITTPKTEKSNRTVQMPQNVCDKMRDYIQSLYKPEPDERIFPFTKYFLTSEMQRGSKAAGVKRIRIHDLRHSHISLLIDMGFPLTAIAARVGHETVDITCMYGHMLPSRQTEMAEKLDMFRTETKEESHDTKASYNNVY